MEAMNNLTTQQMERIILSLEGLAKLAAAPFHKIGDAILVGNLSSIKREVTSFPDDPTGFEAYINHVHLEDILPISMQTITEQRELLFRIGISIIIVWSERMKILLNGRDALFYLGGQDTVSLRFHVDRGDDDRWVDLSDVIFLKRERVDVFRTGQSGIIPIHRN